MFPLERPRRLRGSATLRDLVAEVDLSPTHLIQPYFLHHEPKTKVPIKGFSGIFRWGEQLLLKQIESDRERGLKQFLLFGLSTQKSEEGDESLDPKGPVPSLIRQLRKHFSEEIVLFSDVCLCPYTSQGHCGVMKGASVANDPSTEKLSQMALVHAEAGVDMVAPSDMMDGRIRRIRERLDEQGFETGILAYTAKYASNYYGPFREAVGTALKGDRKTYQMDFRNLTEALRELRLDIQEGADIVMVKPALAYLDIIAQFAAHSDVPVAAYSVSAEYEMVKRICADGTCDERAMILENLTAIRRAGASIIVTYFASSLLEKRWL